jgi:hypothetical protein
MPISKDASRPGLSFARPVDRALIHRRNDDETFLTDAVPTGHGRFAAVALLPAAHPHYSAHTGPSRHRDPMLLLECARQAVACAGHTMFGVELGARMVLRSGVAEFAESAEPGRLVMTATTRTAAGRGIYYELELWAADAWAGRVGLEIGYISGAAYAIIRSGTDRRVPSPQDLARPGGSPIAPGRVGRVRAADTLLLDVTARPGKVTARLRVPVGNLSLLDRAQDRIPAMVLMEAARQLAGFATHQWGGPSPDRTQMAAIRSSFGAYAELDEPVELTATCAVPADGRSVDVTFRQAGTEIARVRAAMAVAAAIGGTRSR